MKQEPSPADEIALIRSRLEALAAERDELLIRLDELQRASVARSDVPQSKPAVASTSAVMDKIVLFRRLFGGRTDVFPVRWENPKSGKSGYAPACANEWVRGVCGKPQVKCGDCPSQNFIPVTPDVIECHLRGEDRVRPNGRGGPFVAGVYPLLFDDTCGFLAVDFDGKHWIEDAQAFLASCRDVDVPAALERSRSGNGGHIWLFFSEPVAAADARRLGTLLLTRTMNQRPEIGFKSYDRLFPSQDSMPSGGLGNLIALPLQRQARESGNSVFVDDELRPHCDQWAYLSTLSRMSSAELLALIAKLEAEMPGGATGVRLPIDDENADEPWKMSPSRRPRRPPIADPMPRHVEVVLADQVYVDRTGLPSSSVAQLVRIAAFQNPESYRAQAMRLPTYGKPRIISCAELHSRHVGLPRGCLEEAIELLESFGTQVRLKDERHVGERIDASFVGNLHDIQAAAVAAIEPHHYGVLAATTAFGKTVVGARMIAARGVNTLVLVHRRQLVDQWRERLRTFLSITETDIGTVGGGKRRPTGKIDIALIQSLVRNGEVSDLVGNYGHLIVDECHHLSAVSFELVARRSRARYVLGLSATVARKDGHHPIIFMQCGPVRYRVDAKSQAATRSFAHKVRLRDTGFCASPNLDTPGPMQMTALYAALANDEKRNELIFDDVLLSLERGRRPVILTERRDHLDHLRDRLAKFTKNLVVLYGGMSARERQIAEEGLRRPDTAERLVLATGRYLGEGFDDASLDTLFLTMPISWRGTLAQYVGRLHREHHAKREVIVYDYIDSGVAMLARMALKRQTGYRSLGYEIAAHKRLPPVSTALSRLVP
ncbi:MAG: DEAD/DEAH box helicase [Alphaproteobacteria bacterium]|nr:DEAD/DEAH box helicase [Alphaproteobacteria bacterium]